MDLTYDILDPDTAAFADLVNGLAEVSGRLQDEHDTVSWSVAEMEVETPLELDVHVQADGSVILGSTPPTDAVGTSFSPLLNQIKITLAPENDLR